MSAKFAPAPVVRAADSSASPGTERRPEFIIFSLSRCGSTTLMRALNCHPGVRCIDEPFNTYNPANAHRAVNDARSLDAMLQTFWTRFNAMKHVWHHSGWPFPANPALNDRLLIGLGCKVVFLWRRNILRRAVSSQISKQTGVWDREGEAAKNDFGDFSFRPLDLQWIEWHVRRERESIARRMELLARSNVEWLDLCYEDLYADELTARERWEGLGRVLAFLGVPDIADQEAMEAVRQVLQPTRTKLNSPEIYRRIPGIKDVERRFGSDETGWLLR